MRPAHNFVPNTCYNSRRVLPPPDGVDGLIPKTFVVVWDIEANGKDDEEIERNDSQGDFAGCELNGLVSVDMFVFGSCD